jgi:hypothetical protein
MRRWLRSTYTTGHFARHPPIVFPILDILPDWLVSIGQPEVLPVVGMRKVLLPSFYSTIAHGRFADVIWGVGPIAASRRDSEGD